MNKEANREKLQQILNDAQLHHLMHNVVDIILSYTTQDPADFSRPYLRFIESAYVDVTSYYREPYIFFLNGQPQELVTPWGGWQCFDTGRYGNGSQKHEKRDRSERSSWARVIPELTKRLGLQVVQSWKDKSDGYELFYDQFTLSKVDDATLLQYYGYQEVYDSVGSDLFDCMEAAWKSLEARYAVEHELGIYPGLEIAINDAALHAAAHRVADIILGYATQDETVADRPLLQDARSNAPYSEHFHTGLRLLISGGVPTFLYTPWGVWNCFDRSGRERDSSLWDAAFPELRRRFGLFAVESIEEYDKVVYALHEIDGELLPISIAFNDSIKESPFAIGKIEFAWKRLENRRNNREDDK
jgi:hypothetical protein